MNYPIGKIFLRLLLTNVAVIFFGHIVNGQINIIQVINSSGGNYEKGNSLMYWSIGELTLVNEMESFDGTIIITNGFIQPEEAAGDPVMTAIPNEFVSEMTSPQIRIFPNPAQNILQIDYRHNVAGKIQIQILDNNGRIVYKNTVTSTGSGFLEKINIQSLAHGSYVLTLSNNSGPVDHSQYSYKIVKL
jgi:hypothetical protein